jgi:6-pyruvoyltetrahydropterin/6-carboxytetrahydropterin synthase
MHATVCKSFDFPAAHRNTRHEGHCNRVHGHTWQMDIYVRGPLVMDESRSDYGMVADFADIKKAYEEAIEPYVEHHMLNDTLPFLQEYTTEVIAGWAYRELKKVLPNLCKVRLWEGRTSFAEVSNGDILR